MSPGTLAVVLGALLGGGTLVAVINAVAQRRRVQGDTTAVVTAAARELVDPLRKELAAEREHRAHEVESERERFAAMRVELQGALAEAKALRNELAMARVEADALRREREVYRARIRELEGRADGAGPNRLPRA